VININQLKSVKLSKLLFALLLSTGLLSSQTYALDLGKVLEDAVKEKVQEVANGGEAPANKAEVSQLLPRQQAQQIRLHLHLRQQKLQALLKPNHRLQIHLNLTGKSPVAKKKLRLVAKLQAMC
jgi:hypothetical protein